MVKDINLALAIANAYKAFQQLDGKETYEKPEGQLIGELCKGFCHLYPEETRNPYLPLAAKGPWIVTMYWTRKYASSVVNFVKFANY